MRSAAGGSYFYHYDKTGNTVAITNESGNTVNTYAYTAYGEIAGSTETVANRFKYVGAYGVVDEGSGIYFMKNRYYDATTGRFLQKDPIGFAGGQTNLYAYVGGNPVTGIDPTGLLYETPPVGPFLTVSDVEGDVVYIDSQNNAIPLNKGTTYYLPVGKGRLATGEDGAAKVSYPRGDSPERLLQNGMLIFDPEVSTLEDACIASAGTR